MTLAAQTMRDYPTVDTPEPQLPTLTMQQVSTQGWDAVIAGFSGLCQEQLHTFASTRWPGVVEEPQLFFDGERYAMHAWVIMPNHVHALFTPARDRSLSDIMLSWKSFTSRKANELLGRSGRFWQEDYFDRYVRDEAHYGDVRAYIENNPVKAGLCAIPEEWPFGSARFRH